LKFIDALRLRSKLFFLFILITLGLAFIGIIGTINLINMKKKIDTLYFGSFITVTNLDEILNSYHTDVETNLYLSKEKIITAQEALDGIDSAKLRINKNWKEYKEHYKSASERPYVDYADKEIAKSNLYLDKVKTACQSGYDLGDLSIPNLTLHVRHIRAVISNLRNYEIARAEYQRKELLNYYHETQIQLGTILVLIIGGVLLISYVVFKSIQKDNSDLEKLTKKLKTANQRLENASYTDSLTGLYNRRYFNVIIDREIKRAKRANSEITFMMLDVDYFKYYNDTYGHIEGDNALKAVASVLRTVLKRPGDYVFRLGGEEFGVLIVETSPLESESVALKICQELELRKIPHATSQVSEYLTLSVGVVACVGDETLFEEDMIKQADKKLYEAKESGRNRYAMSYGVVTR
jgi:diguanylate cyclase (GGDEF)-like protein